MYEYYLKFQGEKLDGPIRADKHEYDGDYLVLYKEDEIIAKADSRNLLLWTRHKVRR